MKIIHYIKVASHFWPWQSTFWLGLLHDSIEDGWLDWRHLHCLPKGFACDLLTLTRKDDVTYAEYILGVKRAGGRCALVKRADLVENYKRARPSLRRRYAKAMLILAG